ncbi:MAG: RNB domain-containing ribonuclease, partial [Planctomycetales bacterium]|nr:RNB domain-containing ribonuclease [Planctomycetales bacterium]
MAEHESPAREPIPFAEEILGWVNREQYAPVKVRVLAKKLDVAPEDLVTFRRSVKRLVRKGLIEFGGAHVVHRVKASGPRVAATEPASATKGVRASNRSEIPSKTPSRQRTRREGEVEGRFRRHDRGFGFVRPLEGLTGDREVDDIFVPATATGDAASGDLVVVRVSRKRMGRPNLSGEITEILERRATRFVGLYFERAGSAYAQIDGKAFPAPLSLGDPGAKGAHDGDKVVVEIVHFPSAYETGEAVIVQVLGPRGAPGVDTLSVIHEYHLPGEFPDDVIADAQDQAQSFDEHELGDRLDLTAETIITIDPFDARDFDDAISVERIENDHWRLGVHIADVAHFVRPKSPLDREARERATSVYLPDRVIPMIPETVSNHLASLQPDRVRYTKTAFIELTPDGATVAVDLASSAIRSKRRFTYEEVDEYLASPTSWVDRLTPEVHGLLGNMRDLAAILRRRRRDAGALELTMPEVKVTFDDEGAVSGARKTEHTESHQIIEEFMLAANVAVAERLAAAEIPFLRRVHGAPRPRKMKELTEFVQDLGFEVESLENRFELQRLLIRVASMPEAYAVNYAVLRAMQRAEYSPLPEGHYALASDCYC